MRCLLAPVALMWAGTAQAHSPIEGVGSFYGGLAHPLLVPAHLLVLIVFGLWIGQRGLGQVRTALPVFFGTLATALLLVGLGISWGAETALLVTALTLGLLVVWQRRWSAALYPLAAGLCAAFVGLDSIQPGLSGSARAAALAGTGVGASLCVIYVAGMAHYARRPWQRIAVRVAGSWVAAAALIVLSLKLA